ncbi:hypothetical protein DY360_000330 [Escherichia coli]|nr:hypothetical protein [Escherichia coli]
MKSEGLTQAQLAECNANYVTEITLHEKERAVLALENAWNTQWSWPLSTCQLRMQGRPELLRGLSTVPCTTAKHWLPTLYWLNCGHRGWRWCANTHQSNFAL